MSFSLLDEAWLPARRASGQPVTIRPCDLTGGIETDPIVSIDWPRPDFRLASLEFLIGLLATACPPEDNDDGWFMRWETPPSCTDLQEAFAPLTVAFILDGDGPRFMQDLEDFGGETNRVETLLIDAPGGQTLKKNADHFVKRNAVVGMSRAAAAMALFTLQSFAPAGGAGNRVGLRGGGPLTTLAVPPWRGDGPLPLWHVLWANVPVGEAATESRLKAIFPWLSPTRTSENKQTVTPNDVDEIQGFWGAARRIRLQFDENAGADACDITGVNDAVIVRGWRQRPYGANYAAWNHALSPYYRQKPTDVEWLPVHAQPGGIGYRHWVGLLFDANDTPSRRAASAINIFRGERLHQVAGRADRVTWRLLAAGYDMDNMKARGFVESEMPITEPGDAARETEFTGLLRQLIAGATAAASLLGRAVRRGLFSEGAKVAQDAGLLTDVRSQFWDATEQAFLERVRQAASGTDERDIIRRTWLHDLAKTAMALFAETAPIDASGADRRPDRIAAAAKSLDLALKGHGKDGDALWRALGLPPPETATKTKTKARK